VIDVKFVYFDLGGVFFNWKPALKDLSEHLHRPYEEVEAVFKKYDDDTCRGKISPSGLFKLFGEELNVSVDIQDPEEWWSDRFIPIKPTYDLAAELIKKYKVGLCTNVYAGVLNKIFQKGYVPELSYSTIIESCKIGVVKPEDEFFRIAQEKTGVSSHEILLIDDSAVNVKKASEIGWNTIRFETLNPEDSVSVIKDALKVG